MLKEDLVSQRAQFRIRKGKGLKEYDFCVWRVHGTLFKKEGFQLDALECAFVLLTLMG